MPLHWQGKISLLVGKYLTVNKNLEDPLTNSKLVTLYTSNDTPCSLEIQNGSPAFELLNSTLHGVVQDITLHDKSKKKSYRRFMPHKPSRYP